MLFRSVDLHRGVDGWPSGLRRFVDLHRGVDGWPPGHRRVVVLARRADDGWPPRPFRFAGLDLDVGGLAAPSCRLAAAGHPCVDGGSPCVDGRSSRRPCSSVLGAALLR